MLVAERAGKAVGHGELAFGHGLQLLARFEAGLRVGLRVDDELAGDAVGDRFGEVRIAFPGKRRRGIFVGKHPVSGLRLRKCDRSRAEGEQRAEEACRPADNERLDLRQRNHGDCLAERAVSQFRRDAGVCEYSLGFHRDPSYTGCRSLLLIQGKNK